MRPKALKDFNPPLQAGDVFAFRTRPATSFSPPHGDRYAAFKVIASRDNQAYCVALNGIFDSPPTVAQVSELSWLRKSRFSFAGEPACIGSLLKWECDLDALRRVGTISVTSDDVDLGLACRQYGPLSSMNADVEGEWRWKNDRAAYEQETARERQSFYARLAAERERHATRLKTLTWEKLLAEETFSRWGAHPPFPPLEFAAAARERIRSTILALQMLGPRPKKAHVRAVLRACVEWFNDKNGEFGDVIETEEREDICKVLEELAVVTCHPSLAEEIGNWRTW